MRGGSAGPRSCRGCGSRRRAAERGDVVGHRDQRETRTVTLNCDPVGGDHPQADLACHQLQLVDGNVQRLDARTASTCTKELRTVNAEAKGSWRGNAVDFQLSEANMCSLKARTGALFDF
ncbi:SSI family serine proteinase inhibitor [Saccharopolyspora hordei]|uniref:SSI family serine proteinase inhibitor n=1 Tax=Saccharopolyspora hordei TaxID=1838 RepID=UPI003CD052D2